MNKKKTQSSNIEK